jgi:hypothetical protein
LGQVCWCIWYWQGSSALRCVHGKDHLLGMVTGAVLGVMIAAQHCIFRGGRKAPVCAHPHKPACTPNLLHVLPQIPSSASPVAVQIQIQIQITELGRHQGPM